MKHFLIVDGNFEHIDLLVTCIESRFNNEILVAGTGEEAIYVLENRHDIGAIICDYNTPKGTGGDIYKRYRELGCNIPFILLTEDSLEELKEFDDFTTDAFLHRYIQRPYKMNNLMETIDDILGGGTETQESKYKKIRSQTYLAVHKSNFQFFVKINDDKMIRITQEGEECSSEIKKLQDKGLTFIYLLNEDYVKFLKESYGAMSSILIDENSNAAQKIDAQFDSVDSFHDGLILLGVPERSLALAEESTKATLNNLKQVKGLGPVLAKILSRKGYLQQISLLTNYVSVAIAQETTFGDKRVCEKLSFASMFMDISLENDEQCAVVNVNDPNFRVKFDFGSRTYISNHMTTACELLESYMDLPQDIKNIIMEHHERPNGMGFPRKLMASNVKPLSAIFILAHEFSHRLIKSKTTKEPVKDIMEDLLLNYSSGAFKKAIEGFIKVFKLSKS